MSKEEIFYTVVTFMLFCLLVYIGLQLWQLWKAWKVRKNPPIEEPKKPRKYTATMEITVVNPKTDKHYLFSSKNNFGLKWDYAGDLLIIKQKFDIDGGNWSVVAHLPEFAMTKIERQDFTEVLEPKPAPEL